MVVTGLSAVAFVVMASAMLLLLFFFMNHIFAVLLVSEPMLHHLALGLSTMPSQDSMCASSDRRLHPFLFTFCSQLIGKLHGGKRGNPEFRSRSSDLDCALCAQTVMFCYAAAQGLTAAISAALRSCLPHWQCRSVELPLVGPVEGLSVGAFLVSLLLVVAWGIWRHSSWAWPLQDAMGISLIILLLRQFRLPNIKVGISSPFNANMCRQRCGRLLLSTVQWPVLLSHVILIIILPVVQVACILLPLCFTYDIFWVFIEPMIIGGTSVMVEVGFYFLAADHCCRCQWTKPNAET
jgi:hypothetical protein